MSATSQTLDEENRQVLNLVQAALGSITANMRLIGLTVAANGVTVQFVIECESAADRQAIEDIIFEFEALQTSAVDVSSEVLVNAGPLIGVQLPERLVFRRMEGDGNGNDAA